MIDIFEEYWMQYLGIGQGNISGAVMTLWLLVLSFSIGLAASIPLAILRTCRHAWLRNLTWVYTYVVRGTPLYVQLLIIYTGIFGLEFVRGTPLLANFFRSGFNCAVLAFCINECAYVTEILAGAIRALPYGESEAARAFGFSRWHTYTKIILPAAMKRALPYYSNEIILLLHSTSIAFTATVPEILKVARDVNSATYAPFSAFGIAALIYALIAFTLVAGFRHLERRCLAFIPPGSIS
ncbi:histidine ABC transporter permease HisM [Castellaniella hirudinis]|uniref:histidine ABC transporter permease HisM n=1 Tax=Castellaniella hirudinis TaxID=1144617 RepID=UPI0039C37629